MERLFGLDAQLLFEVFLTAVAVFVLFVALSYILFNPVRDMLKKRQEMVQETKDNAEREKAKALRLKAEYDEKMKKADSKTEEILTEARKRALKKFVADGTKQKGVKCPKCGQETVVYQEKCMLCTTCGYSKCGG